MLAISYVLQNAVAIQSLNMALPGGIWLGVQDVARTFKGQVSAATPIGWKYVKQQKTKRGKTKAGTGKWKRSGVARKAWEQKADFAGRGITVFNPQPYMRVLEEGLYPNPPTGPMPTGVPWTPWRVEGGFSKQAPGGIVGPLFDDNEFWESATDLVIKRVRERLEGAIS
jgi:hypothetical protein